MTGGMGAPRRTEARDEIATFGTAITDGPAEGMFGRLRALALVDLPDALDALDRVEALHQPETFGGETVCSSCLRYTSPLPGRVPYPCATVRALDGEQ